MSAQHDRHLSAEVLQDFLEDALPRDRAAGVEEHLGQCARCSAELDAWRALMTDLDGMEAVEAPSAGFADRVMTQVPVRRPARARLREWVKGWGRIFRPAGDAVIPEGQSHPAPGLLQDFVEGVAPRRVSVALEAHLEACGRCRGEVTGWRTVMTSLGGLPHLVPSAGFQARVLAAVQPSARGRAEEAEGRSPASDWLDRAWNGIGGLVPATTGARVAVAALLLLPVMVALLAVYFVVRHPLLDLQSIAAYAWWQATEGASALAATGAAWLLESPAALQLLGWVATAADAPGTTAAALVAAWTVSAAAAWVLYRNLIIPDRKATGSHG